MIVNTATTKMLQKISNFSQAKALITVFLCLLSALITAQAKAHALNENYIWLNIESDHMVGRFEVNINDLSAYLDIEIDQSEEGRLQQAVDSAKTVQEYVEDNFSLTSADESSPVTYPLLWLEPTIFTENPDYLQYHFKTDSIPPDNKLTVHNSLFLGEEVSNFNKLHRSVLVIEYNKKLGKEFGHEHSALVFKRDRQSAQLDLENPDTVLNWKEFLWQGVLHIIYGPDHVLFIIVLLLTTVLRADSGRWVPLPSFRPAFINTLKIITLFTIAHSITLTLAALKLVEVNTVIVESIIAFSIIVIALNNLKPRFNTHAWILVFLFGLFHGLGFASVMGDLHFRTVLLERILIMFNLGVELGQVAILIVVFPILYLLRTQPAYHRYLVIPVSLIAIAVALFWFLQRTGLIPT